MARLILCGGGHVSLELAYMASRLDFEIHVIDDRPEFANTKRFPMAKIYQEEFESALNRLGSGPEDYFAVLTRGHAWETECVAHILGGSLAYLGMIGSKAKVAAVRARLAELGFSPEAVDRIHAPIGLKLGGQTPAEIAVSIAAQLVQVRAARGGTQGPRLAGHGMLATIVEKRGSAPRGVGAAMLVAPDGSCTGTIGGGALEFQARAAALALLRAGEEYRKQTFDLGPAAGLGMVCGGTVTVEFTKQ